MNFLRKHRGFSIAEAMITLLIVSLAMAAMAPIMSKQMKREVSNNADKVTQQVTTNNYTYRIWSNGYKECWMNVGSNGANGVTLPVTYTNTRYYAIVGQSQISNLHPILEERFTNKIKIAYTEGGGRGKSYNNNTVTIYTAGY